MSSVIQVVESQPGQLVKVESSEPPSFPSTAKKFVAVWVKNMPPEECEEGEATGEEEGVGEELPEGKCLLFTESEIDAAAFRAISNDEFLNDGSFF